MERHDGTGATCEDFQKAMADANPDTDLKQFSLWYSTAGTPRISYAYSYQDNQLKLRLSQQLPDNDSTLLHIPITVGLLNKETGQEVVPSKVLNLKQKTQTFVFDNLSGNIIPSMLRDFSAPVILLPADDHKCIVSEEEQLAFLATYDTDEFNKWEAMQNLFSRYIFKLMSEENEEDRFLKLEAQVMIAFGQTLQDSALGHSSKSYILNLPTESVLSRQLDKIPDPIRLLDARKEATQRIARKHSEALQHEYNELSSIVIATSDITDVLSRATRSLRNRCLEYLCSLRGTRNEQEIAGKLALRHFDTAICFTGKSLIWIDLHSREI
jgi:aminopeptidase N